MCCAHYTVLDYGRLLYRARSAIFRDNVKLYHQLSSVLRKKCFILGFVHNDAKLCAFQMSFLLRCAVCSIKSGITINYGPHQIVRDDM